MLLIWIKDVLMLPLSRGLFDPKSKGGFRGVGAGRWPQGGLKMRACPSREGSFPEFMPGGDKRRCFPGRFLVAPHRALGLINSGRSHNAKLDGSFK